MAAPSRRVGDESAGHRLPGARGGRKPSEAQSAKEGV